MSAVAGYLVGIIIVALILVASYGALLQRRYPRDRQEEVTPENVRGDAGAQARPQSAETSAACSTCGRALRPGARFCSACGADSQASR